MLYPEKEPKNDWWVLDCLKSEPMHGEGGKITDFPYVVMQWTGLQDKNGVDIYEGDIMTTNNEEFSKINTFVEVMWVYDGFSIVNRNCCERCKNGGGEICSLGEGLSYKLEVVGNIYENESLLPVKND